MDRKGKQGLLGLRQHSPPVRLGAQRPSWSLWRASGKAVNASARHNPHGVALEYGKPSLLQSGAIFVHRALIHGSDRTMHR